jgi:hypothetical protein
VAETPAKTKQITIIVNHNPLHFDHAEVPASEIMERAGIPSTNLLFLEVPGPADDIPIASSAIVTIKSGQHYYDMPPGNFGGGR